MVSGLAAARRAARESAKLVLADRKDDMSKAACPPKMVSAQARVADAEEVSNVILFLASDETGNMTGTTVPVDGGFVCY